MAAKKARKSQIPKGRYLRRFSLENVRVFRSPISLNFCFDDGRLAQWTVILGENGTGKTTLLQYLAGMTFVPDEDALREGRKGNKNQPPALRPMLAGNDWFGWHAANLPKPRKAPTELNASFEVSQPASEISEAKREKDAPNDLGLKIEIQKTKAGADRWTVSYVFHKASSFYSQFKIFAYGASRHIAGPASPYLSSERFLENQVNSPINTMFNDDHPLISPEQWLLGLDHAAKSDDEIRKWASRAFESARRCLSRTLPGIEELFVKPNPSGLGKGQTAMTLVCKTAYGEVPFSSLSLGYRTMAAWLTDFIKRMHESYPDLDEPDDGPAIVIIDEFDLHMHPRWQRKANGRSRR